MFVNSVEVHLYTMKKNFISLTFLCVCLLAFAGQSFAKDIWINVRSKNFNLIGNAKEKEIQGVATKLEQFRETFRQLFPNANFNAAVETNVVVFRNESSYRPFKPKRADGKADRWIAGYFQPGEDLNYITLSTEGEKEDTYEIIFHEYVHFLLNTNFGRSTVPPWFNEGLAEYYQTFRVKDEKSVVLGEIQDNHLLLLQQNKLIPLKTFFEIDNYSLHQNANHSRSIFYAQAWALMHYLVQGKGGANNDGLNKFLSLVMKKVEPEKAFQQAFQTDYATMEKDLKRYVEQRTYKATLVTFKNALTVETEMKTVPLSDAEANAYLGDLLYHTHEYADAEGYLQKALALDAESTMANTSFGLVKMRQRKFAEARKYLEKAVASDGRNHFAHYNYAYVMSREDMDETGLVRGFASEKAVLMRRSLQKAIEIKPDFSESYRLLAFVNLVNNEELDESLVLLKKGLALQPGNQDYALLTAQIYMRQDKFAEAREIAERLAKTAAEQYMRLNAQSILRSIGEMETTKANYEKMRERMSANNSGNAPSLVRKSNLGEAGREKIEADRKIDNINRMIEKPKANEKQAVGFIEKISCPNGEVLYSFKNDTEKFTLSSKDFQSLNLVSLTPESEDLQVGCDADTKNTLTVITFISNEKPKAKTKGDLTAMYFVPKDFRLKTEAEIAENESKRLELYEESVQTAVEGGIKSAMRQMQSGEKRELVIPEKIECSGRTVFFIVKTGAQTLKLKTDSPQSLKIMAFTPEVGQFQMGCGVKLPPVSAVVTFRPSADNKDKVQGEIVSLEFVPEGFKLD